MDNHDSHILLSSLQFAKDNGIVLLTIHPQTSNKLQPLDISVFYSFIAAYNRTCNCWIINNNGKVIDIHTNAKFVGTTFPRAFQPINIKSGFQKTRIWPFNMQMFSKDSFLPAHMTDRDDPS